MSLLFSSVVFEQEFKYYKIINMDSIADDIFHKQALCSNRPPAPVQLFRAR